MCVWHNQKNDVDDNEDDDANGTHKYARMWEEWYTIRWHQQFQTFRIE